MPVVQVYPVAADKHPHKIGHVEPVGAPNEQSAAAGIAPPQSRGFKFSTGACARAIARDKSLDITFDDKAADTDGTVLPGIPDNATLQERLQTRGRSDAIALHKQYHDPKIHRRHLPATDTSQRLHNLAEQTRVELLGSTVFEGVGRNLDAALDSRYELLLDTIRKPAVALNEMPEPRLGIDHALALYLREQLGDRPLPPAAADALSDWRQWLDSDVHKRLKPSSFDIHDQGSFAKALGNLLRSLELDDSDIGG